MATTITERVYDDLTHKLRQWEKLTPAPHEILGALKSWSALGNADIEAAANAAAGLAVKAVVDFGRVTKLLNAVLRISSVGKLSPAQIQALDKIGMAIRFAQVEARDAGNEKLSRELNQAAYAATLAYTAYANGDAKKGAKQLSLAVQYMRRSLDFAEKSVTPKSVKAFANVPDVPAALAHLRTAHTAIKAQVDAERNAPPRDGGFAGVKAAPVDTARVQKLYNALRKIETLRQMTPRDIQALDKIGMAYAFASNEARNAGNKPVQQALMEASFAITTAYTAYSKGNNGTGNTKLAQARMFTDRALQLLRGA